MDVYEATRVVLSRIQSLDPANASKIMGLLLLQDHGEKEMIRLAFGPQNLLHSVMAKAKKELGLMDSAFMGGRAAGLMMMGDDDLGRWRIDLSAMACPASRQIYLTFPADSLFREEDVSNYFSTYGPVEDVRIPYQQKRMFGFVTFVYPETVKTILAKGNPHFVCDSRVLVKPYKEKGKVPDKYRTKPSPDCLDSRDIMLGGRAFQDNTLLMFEERALELQSRRLMNLQLLDVKKHFQLGSPRPFVSPRLDNSLSQVVHVKEGSEEEPIKLPESLEDSPFASPKHHFLECNGSSPSFESSTSTLSDSFKCQMPLIGMLAGPTCRVGI